MQRNFTAADMLIGFIRPSLESAGCFCNREKARIGVEATTLMAVMMASTLSGDSVGFPEARIRSVAEHILKEIDNEFGLGEWQDGQEH